MFSFLKKTVSGRSPSAEFDRNNLVRDEFLKKQLKDELAGAIKRLQRNHITAEHEIDRNDEDALLICSVLEAIFLHGYKDRNTRLRSNLQSASVEEIQNVSFWDILEEITHSDVISQVSNLSVTSKVGMCRAWVRMAFNDGLIESYMDAVLRNKANLKSYYSQNAFLMDDEALPIAIELLQGLMEFQFHLNYNSSKLDEWDYDSLFLAGLAAGKPRMTSESNTPPRQLPGYLAAETRVKASSFASSQTSSDAGSDLGQFSDLSIITTTATTAPTISSQNSPSTFTSETSSNDHATLSSSSNEQLNLVQTVGNRISLADEPWAGWSSAFDANPGKTSERHSSLSSTEVSQHDGRNAEPSFDSLLQTYAPTPMRKNTQNLEIFGQDVNGTPTYTEVQPECPISPSEDENVQQMNYEVVPMSSSLNTQHTDERTQFLLDHITVIGLEKGLDKQSFQCLGCGRPIGLIYGQYKVCYYDGGYYCLECHEDESHTIPAKIIHNWDFKPYKVSKLTKMFLMKIEEEPLFHIDEINPTLYNAVPELNEVKMLRIQLQHLKGFILTCKNDIAEDFRRRLWPREYMCDDVHQYSSLDLVQVHTGQLLNHLKKILIQFSKHVYKCALCSQKGFICEICNSQKIIYPFEIATTFQCHRCLSLYHKKCKQDRRCVKCLRLQFRKKGEETEWP